jgi:hypothetical protein
VLVRTENRNELRDVTTGRLVLGLPVSSHTPAALSADGRTLAMLAWDGARKARTMMLTNATTGARLWQNAVEKPSDDLLVFDSSGERLAVFGFDKRVTFFDAQNGTVLQRTPPVAQPHALFIGDDFALVDDEHGLGVVDLATWKSRWRVVQRRFPRGFVVPRDASFFFEFERAVVRRRSLRTGLPLGAPIDLTPSDDSAVAIATSNDGKTLVVGTQRGVLLRFELRE